MVIFFFKQKTAYELRISDWSSDVCSSDLRTRIFRYRRTHDDSFNSQSKCDDPLGSFEKNAAPSRLNGAASVDAGVEGVPVVRSRSEERRVGQGGVSKCRSRWLPHT